MRVLDLFSGIGGFSVGLHEAGMETVGFCEMDSFCQKVLKKHWPNVPIHSDIKELNGHEYRGTVELVCGGFPCQPFSVAGKQGGSKDDRALWPEMLRVIQEVQPTWVIGENVSGIINMELDSVLSDLEAEGYATQTFVLPACAVDAKHRRDRVWIIGYTNSDEQSSQRKISGRENAKSSGVRSDAHPNCEGESDGPQHEQRMVADSDNAGDRASQSRTNAIGEEIIKRGQKQSQFEPSGFSEDVANPSSEPWWGGGVHQESTDERRAASKARGESVQPKHWETQPDNTATCREDVADTAGSLGERERIAIGVSEEVALTDSISPQSHVADSSSQRRPRSRQSVNTSDTKAAGQRQTTEPFYGGEPHFWGAEPGVGRVADGVPNRTHRLKGLGNAVVPTVVTEIGRVIMHFHENGIDPRG